MGRDRGEWRRLSRPRGLPVWVIAVFMLFGGRALAQGEHGPALLKKARDLDHALRQDQRKLQYRHHLEALIGAWQSAKEALSGRERLEAEHGEAAAWRLLAHWSGLPADRERANALTQRLERKSKKALTAPSVLKQIEVRLEAGSADLVLRTSGPFEVRRVRLPSRGGARTRIYFDFRPMIAAREVLAGITFDHPEVSGVRVGQFNEDTVRIAFDVSEASKLNADLQFSEGRIRVPRRNLGKGAGEAALAGLRGGADDPLEQKPANIAEIGEAARRLREMLERMMPSEQEESSSAGDGEIASFLADIVAEVRGAYPDVDADETKTNPDSRDVLGKVPKKSENSDVLHVVIDAGHGGRDVGARSATGVYEKDVNLAIAKMLGRELERKLGAVVTHTRAGDQYVSLKDRAKIANSSGADLFISVHANAHKDRRIRGIETYYLKPSLRSRSSEVSSDSLTLDLEKLVEELTAGSGSEDSHRLAQSIQGALFGRVQKIDRSARDLGVKHALFYVLLGARMPAVLVETGFMSHPVEGRRLSSERYQRKIAEGIAQGVERYVERQGLIARASL